MASYVWWRESLCKSVQSFSFHSSRVTGGNNNLMSFLQQLQWQQCRFKLNSSFETVLNPSIRSEFQSPVLICKPAGLNMLIVV